MATRIVDTIFNYITQNDELLALERALETAEAARMLENDIIDIMNISRNSIEQEISRNSSQNIDDLIYNEVNHIIVNVMGLPVFLILTPEQRPPIADLMQTIFDEEDNTWWTIYESNRRVSRGSTFNI